MTRNNNLSQNNDGTSTDNARLIMLARQRQILAEQMSEEEQIRAWRLAAQGCCGTGESSSCTAEQLAESGGQKITQMLARDNVAAALTDAEAYHGNCLGGCSCGREQSAPYTVSALAQHSHNEGGVSALELPDFGVYASVDIFAVAPAAVYKAREQLLQEDEQLKSLLMRISDLEAVHKTAMYQAMKAGLPYHPADLYLQALRNKAAYLCYLFRQTNPLDYAKLKALLALLFADLGNGAFVMSGLNVDYGVNTTLAKNVFINSNCTILDIAPVSLGENSMLGPNCGLYTVNHPLAANLRLSGQEQGQAITIGKNVWLAANVIVLPGVTIGDNTVVGAGSVVNKSLPPGVLAVGNPARVVKHLSNYYETE